MDTVTCAGQQGEGGMGRIFLDINRPRVCLLEVEEAWLLKGHSSSLCDWIDLSFYPCSVCTTMALDEQPRKARGIHKTFIFLDKALSYTDKKFQKF